MCVGGGLVQRLIVSGVCRMFVGGRGSALFGTMVGGAINSSFDSGETPLDKGLACRAGRQADNLGDICHSLQICSTCLMHELWGHPVLVARRFNGQTIRDLWEGDCY